MKFFPLTCYFVRQHLEGGWMASLASRWDMESRGQDTGCTWVVCDGSVGVYNPTHRGYYDTEFNLTLLVPRAPAGLATWLII